MTKEGEPKRGVEYLASFETGTVERELESLQNRWGSTSLLVVDLEPLRWTPWAPFAELARGLPGAPSYFRHRHLFAGEQNEASEPLIEEELLYEKGRLADSLLDRLSPKAGPPRIVVVRNAQLLGPEAYFLLQRHNRAPSHPLRLVIVFERPSPPHGTFDRLDSLGFVNWLGSSPLESRFGQPRPPDQGPSPEQIRRLFRWLCFETLSSEPSLVGTVEALEALGYHGGFEEGIDLGESLVRRLASDADRPALARVWFALSRLYRQAGDSASAARCLTLRWKLAVEAGDRVAQTECEFILFENSYRTLVTEDVALGLEDRLEAALEALGWSNHLAYMNTKNVWIQTVGRTKGWSAAGRLVALGMARVKRLGNHRRLSVALQTTGSLLSIQGDIAGALRTTRRALALALTHSSPLHSAKVENGLGYLYFLAGDFRSALRHHAQALAKLPETRDHLEFIGTLVNMGRLYLFNDQPLLATPLLSAAIRTMDDLGIDDLPFHPRANTYALLGVCCLKNGQTDRALQFLSKVKFAEVLSGSSSEHRACLEALLVAERGQKAEAEVLFDEAFALLLPRVGDLRHLILWLLRQRAAFREVAGDFVGANNDLKKVSEVEFSAAGPRPSGDRQRGLPAVAWESPLLIRSSKQESALRSLRRTVLDYGFLQTWHEQLVPGLNFQELYLRAVRLIHTHFAVESVLILDGKTPEVIASSSPESEMTHLAALAVDTTVSRSTFSLLEVFPVRHSGTVQARVICFETGPSPIFAENDRRVLGLAVDHLAILLLASRRALDLEERGDHLTRALEILKDTQDRLVRSENLAVLGNLSAGLAHELNTPLGAILSASRTVQSLISGELSDLGLRSQGWSVPERELFEVLLARLLASPPDLLTSDRGGRRALASTLKEWGVEDPATQAELWVEVDLGQASDLHRSWCRDAVVTLTLERLVPVAQALRMARVIEESAQRAEAVIGGLKSYLQGTPDENPTLFPLRKDLESTLVLLGLPTRRGLEVVWSFDGEPRLRGRRLALSQVWTNLVQNALQAMEGRGTLTLTATTEAEEVVVSVGDTGGGIPASSLDRVFEPFYSTKKQRGGLGLGLDICRRIVESHGGRMEVRSRPGSTVFSVHLPRPQGEAPGQEVPVHHPAV